MKLLFGVLMVALSASAFGQDVEVPAVAARAVRSATDVIVAGVKKNAPFTADESGETVRIMPDGNRIVENWTGKMARSSDGRIRRDITSGKVGDRSSRPIIFGGGIVSPGIVALGAGDGVRYTVQSKIDAETGARTIVTTPGEGSAGLTLITTTGNDEEARRVLITKIEEAAASGAPGRVRPEVAARAAVDSEAVRAILPAPVAEGKFNTRKESLGTRDFGGVQAEGTRIVTNIAAGAAGNDREIEVTSEIWFSKDLGVIVYSKRVDPRFGETTYQMTNIVRAEPDASLFPVK
jgi:hypothetical protein